MGEQERWPLNSRAIERIFNDEKGQKNETKRTIYFETFT
jgi:hypothetical protein